MFHELVSPDIHVDICVVPPSEKRDYYTLVTMGMGAHRMNVPEELAEYKLERAELVIALPPDWKLDEESLKNERWCWPIGLLKVLARLPIAGDHGMEDFYAEKYLDTLRVGAGTAPDELFDKSHGFYIAVIQGFSGITITPNPYALEWKNDHYYLIGFSLKHQKIAHFRVDRLTSVENLETYFMPIEGFDVASYTNKMVDMFTSESSKEVTLLCEKTN